MQRGDKTTLSALEPGDRFYKAGDKAKKVYQVGVFTTGNKIECVPDGKNPRYPDNLPATTEVIFLRHTE